MRSFEITHINPATGNLRRKKMNAESETLLRVRLAREGIAPESIQVLPDSAATERQISYARSLGARLPAKATSEQASDAIAFALSGAPSRAQVRYGEARGVEIPQDRLLSRQLLGRLLAAYIPEDQHPAEASCWWLAAVHADHSGVRIEAPHQIRDDLRETLSMGSCFAAHAGAWRSLKTVWGERAWVEMRLPKFGASSLNAATGRYDLLSRRSNAYRSAIEILGGEI